MGTLSGELRARGELARLRDGGRCGFLAAIAATVRERRAREAPTGAALEELRDRAAHAPPAPLLRSLLAGGDTVGLIAEFKRRSPSAGRLAEGERPDEVAALYVEAGAVGVSVLTEPERFGGSLDDLASVTLRLGAAAPVLRKDFIVDTAGLYEARTGGAAAALLVTGLLGGRELPELLQAATAVGLECLVEVHDGRELERALAAGATLLGINNRDLRRLKTDLRTTERLAGAVPDEVVLVSESGIRSAADVARLGDAGADAVLVGEALLRLAPEQRAILTRELAGVPR
ncbi:MAG: indole-3-glycerol-phosphate synthase [Gemmatimonadota bacterium]